MTPVGVAPGVAATASVPRQYVVPSVQGDPAAAHRLAAAYRDLSAAVAATGRQLGAVMSQLDSTWGGVASRSAFGPVDAVMRDVSAVATALDEAADRLETYARAMARAQEHHHFSLHKLLAVGAVVVVAGAALVVTVGAAGVLEAAAATAAVEGATEAAGLATAADCAAADGLLAGLRSLVSLRPLLQFAVPHLTQVAWSAGSVAAYDEATQDRLDWKSMGVAAGVAVLGSSAAAALTGRAETAGWLAGTSPGLQRAAPHLIQGGFWGGVDAADELAQGHGVHPLDVLETAGIAGGGSALHDTLRERGILFHDPDYRRAALVVGLRRPGRILDPAVAREMATLRQPVDDLTGGRVDLRLHEGPGHTMRRHVGKSGQWLVERARSERRRFASSFWDETTAQRATNAALAAADKQQLHDWLASDASQPFRTHLRFTEDVGVVVTRKGVTRFARQVVVVLQRDNYGQFVLTSYPELSK